MFATLSYNEQVKRLTRLARAALAHYALKNASLKDAELSLIAHWQNTTFWVDTPDKRYALRVNRPASQSLASIRSELLWLEALTRDTDLCVPTPYRNDVGELLTIVAGETGTRHCVLFSWLDGDFLDEKLTPAHLETVGAFTAKLHRHSETFVPPPGFERRRLEWDGQMSNFFTQPNTRANPVVTPDLWTLFDEVRSRTEPVMTALGRSPDVYGLVHNDVYQENMLFAEGAVQVFDFDNCGYAHYLLDAAVTLAQVRKHADYAQKRAAYLKGYARHRALSQGELDGLEAFLAARVLLLALYYASQTDNPKMKAAAPAYITGAAADLRGWLATGRVL